MLRTVPSIRSETGRASVARLGIIGALIASFSCGDGEGSPVDTSDGAGAARDVGGSAGSTMIGASGGASESGQAGKAGFSGSARFAGASSAGGGGASGASGAAPAGASGQASAGTAGTAMGGESGTAGSGGAFACSLDDCPSGPGKCCAFQGRFWNAPAQCWGTSETVGCYPTPDFFCSEALALTCYARGEGEQRQILRAGGVFSPASLPAGDGWQRCDLVPGLEPPSVTAAECEAGTGGSAGAGGGAGAPAGESCAFDAAAQCTGAPKGEWCCGVSGTVFDVEKACWLGEQADVSGIGPVVEQAIACADGLCPAQQAPGCYRMTLDGRDVRIWSYRFIIDLPASVVGTSDLRKCTEEERKARSADEARPRCP